jgi:hypothetical protein
MALPIALEIELDLLVRRVFETAGDRGVELDASQAQLMRFAFVVGVNAATRDPRLLGRLEGMLLLGGGLQDSSDSV